MASQFPRHCQLQRNPRIWRRQESQRPHVHCLSAVNNIWLVGFNHLEKYESQWEGLSHILWKNNMFETVDFLQYSSMAMENTHRHSFTKCVPSKKKRIFHEITISCNQWSFLFQSQRFLNKTTIFTCRVDSSARISSHFVQMMIFSHGSNHKPIKDPHIYLWPRVEQRKWILAKK